MEERTPLPSHAIIGGVCRILADVVEHASSRSRVCLFKAAGDESRYVSEDEWLEGAAQYERTAREKALVDKDSTGAETLALFR